MRIIGGKFKGRRLNPPNGLPVRPTTDFAKEGLFNVLNNIIDFEDIEVLDLFAGTGHIAFEFISRGASAVTAVDMHKGCVAFIDKTSESLGMENLHAVRANVFAFLKYPRSRFDLIFADPPYEMEGIDKIPELILQGGLLKDDGLLILEHSPKYNFTLHPNFDQQREYGRVNFSFFLSKENSTRA
jgi:16S rRNA (guanine966-N2)-methyltransferase